MRSGDGTMSWEGGTISFSEMIQSVREMVQCLRLKKLLSYQQKCVFVHMINFRAFITLLLGVKNGSKFGITFHNDQLNNSESFIKLKIPETFPFGKCT